MLASHWKLFSLWEAEWGWADQGSRQGEKRGDRALQGNSCQHWKQKRLSLAKSCTRLLAASRESRDSIATCIGKIYNLPRIRLLITHSHMKRQWTEAITLCGILGHFFTFPWTRSVALPEYSSQLASHLWTVGAGCVQLQGWSDRDVCLWLADSSWATLTSQEFQREFIPWK